MDSGWEWLVNASAWVLPVVFAITLHEAAHGWMANRFGDSTARLLGRVTFNPLKHVDRVGTILIPGVLMLAQSPVMFGYAKPVPVDFHALHPRRLGMFMVAIAGPATNVILALLCALLLHVDQFVTPEDAPWLFLNLYRAISINCVLALFNMLPLMPLDGGRVVASLLPRSAQRFYGLTERWGIILIMLLLVVPPFFGVSIFQELLATPVFWLVEQVLHLTGNGN